MVRDKDGRVFAWDAMFDRPLHGTTDWQPIEMVADVPREPCVIIILPTLYGTGEIWCDDFQIDAVPADTPITDSRRWTVWCQDPNDYSESTDYNVTHNGHPVFCLAYVSPDAPQKYSFVWWGRHNDDIKTFRKYLGHTVRMTVWAKSENISDHGGTDLQAKDASGRQLVEQIAYAHIRGSTDWTQQSSTSFIPEDTRDFQTGFFMHSSGKAWIDTDSIKLEIVK
jgi:hypothetical protein